MCGRFTLATPPEILAALFDVEEADWNDPRFNIAPRTRVVTVRRDGHRRVARSLLWGAISPGRGRPLINARSETAATLPAFARAFAAERVLVPADGFFEWTLSGSKRQARYFRQDGGRPFAIGGIAVASNSPGDSEPAAAVLLTRQASPSVMDFHHRMPLLVAGPDFEAWLDVSARPEALSDIIDRGAEAVWTAHTVGPAVNQPRNDSPENIRFVEPAPDRQGRLF